MSLRPYLLSLAFALVVCFGDGLAQADDSSLVSAEQSRLDQMLLLSEHDNQAALKQLQNFYSTLTTKSDYLIRIDTMNALVDAYWDAGNEVAYEAMRRAIVQLAQSQNDHESLALIELKTAYDLRDQGRFEQAMAALDRIAAAVAYTTFPERRMRVETAYGALYSAMSQFERALEHHLAAYRLSEQARHHAAIYKLRRLATLSGLYLTMQNPEQSLLMSEEALKLEALSHSPRVLAQIRQNQAMALSDLERYRESLAAYEASLHAAQEANIPKMEALILSNIADLHLRTHQFEKAESVSRLSLLKAQQVGDKSAINNAKANIGFGLGGQGKIPQAMEYLREVIQVSRDSGDKADLELTVGEVGRMFERAKMYKEAIVYAREQLALRNEIFRSGRTKTVALLQEQFDTDQRKKQFELLGRENQIKNVKLKNNRLQAWVISLGALVSIMVGIFIYMLYLRVKQTNIRLAEMNDQLEFHSVRDALTGLFNRRSFLEMMKHRATAVVHDRRADDSSNPDCLMLLDIDHFKHINDTWGHTAGDVVLVEIAKRLRAAVRDSDMSMRWGGEEFLIYSPKTHVEHLLPMVERILAAIGSSPVLVGPNAIPVTASAGFISLPFADVPEEICNWEKALQLADLALYLGKVHGRNRAYGLMSLSVPYIEALPELEHDFAEAIKKEMVDVQVILGPHQAH